MAETTKNDGDSRKAGERMTLTIKGVEYAFRWIPAGSFVMGSPPEENEEARARGQGRPDELLLYYRDEVQRKVDVSRGFWMLESPITQGMWKSVMRGNPSYFKGSDRLPVENISWNDCQEYIGKLNGFGVRPKGYRFSLPTEAEWEYACRAGATTAYSFGDALNGDKANCDGNYPFGTDKKGPYLEKTTEVGKYGANAWGLVDMHGNVREWVQDAHGTYQEGEATDWAGSVFATCRVLPNGALSHVCAYKKSDGPSRVLRGGSWSDRAVDCRAAFRGWNWPIDRDEFTGARLALRPVD